jgi:hypothetical protein
MVSDAVAGVSSNSGESQVVAQSKLVNVTVYDRGPITQNGQRPASIWHALSCDVYSSPGVRCRVVRDRRHSVSVDI